MITKLKIIAVAALSFLAAACQQTFEDDYQHSSSVHGEASDFHSDRFFDELANKAGG